MRGSLPPVFTEVIRRGSVRASEIQPASTFSDGTRRTSGCSALVCASSVASRAGLCCASSTGESTPAASSRSEYSAPTPRMRMRSMWLSHSSSCAGLRPVSRASASRPLAVAARCSRWRTCVTPARESADACAAPMPSITSILTASPSVALRGDVIRSARGVLEQRRRRAGSRAGDTIRSPPRRCM